VIRTPKSEFVVSRDASVLNAPGCIDPGFTGEVEVLLGNLGSNAVRIEVGQRIAQLLVTPFVRIRWERAERLGESDRGSSGFGASGAM